jgi:hypothetical protein
MSKQTFAYSAIGLMFLSMSLIVGVMPQQSYYQVQTSALTL